MSSDESRPPLHLVPEPNGLHPPDGVAFDDSDKAKLVAEQDTTPPQLANDRRLAELEQALGEKDAQNELLQLQIKELRRRSAAQQSLVVEQILRAQQHLLSYTLDEPEHLAEFLKQSIGMLLGVQRMTILRYKPEKDILVCVTSIGDDELWKSDEEVNYREADDDPRLIGLSTEVIDQLIRSDQAKVHPTESIGWDLTLAITFYKEDGSESFHGLLLADDVTQARQFTRREMQIAAQITGLIAKVFERESGMESLIRENESDSVTTLFNFPRGMQLAVKLIARVLRTRAETDDFFVALFDIDHFKSVNDTYGHLKGDDVLKRVGELINTNAREDEVPVRYGGEELLIFGFGTEDDGMQLAERIRLQVKEKSTEDNWFEDDRQLTISAGIASFNAKESLRPTEAGEQNEFEALCQKAKVDPKSSGARILHILISRADQALYCAKATRDKAIPSSQITIDIDIDDEEIDLENAVIPRLTHSF